jgi:dihydrofolate synthase/folylpolyglutamate synthase
MTFWTFPDAEKYLRDTAPPGKSVYGLGRIRHLLELLGTPQAGLDSITIVGTNGKGSVLAFLESLFITQGVKVVSHVKPHLESVTERIRINGEDSTEEEFAKALWEVKCAVDAGWSRDDRPTYFELLFAAALVAARTHDADLAILEAGLGGRLDAVNAVDSGMVVLTSVDYDHTELLGDTLEQISGEKLAVVRPGSFLVCQENPDEVMRTVREYAEGNNVALVEVSKYGKIIGSVNGEFSYESNSMGEINGIRLGLEGSYQLINARCSLVAFEIYCTEVKPGKLTGGLMRGLVRLGLAGARIPGRWERFSTSDAKSDFILDGAHNPAGLRRVLEEFREVSKSGGTIVFGMKATKHVDEILPELVRSAGTIIFVPVPDVECHEPAELMKKARAIARDMPGFSQIQFHYSDSIKGGLDLASEVTHAGGLILVTGSLYMVGAARSIIRPKQLILDRVSDV